jgi:hypothetical protein
MVDYAAHHHLSRPFALQMDLFRLRIPEHICSHEELGSTGLEPVTSAMSTQRSNH